MNSLKYFRLHLTRVSWFDQPPEEVLVHAVANDEHRFIWLAVSLLHLSVFLKRIIQHLWTDTNGISTDGKWSRSKHTSVPSEILTTNATKPWKTQSGADWDGASLGWVKQRIHYCKYVSWQSSSKPRSRKGTQTASGVSIRHSCQNIWESTVENGQQAKESKRSSFSFKKTVNRKTT